MEDLSGYFTNLVGDNCSRPFHDQGLSFLALSELDSHCRKLIVSKLLGLSVVALCLFLKLPQVLALHSSKSGKGLSVLALSLEMIGYSVLVIFGRQHNLAFSTYGEVVFLVVQDMIIMYLLLLYSDGFHLKSLVLIGLYLLFLGAGLAGYIPAEVIGFLQSCSLFLSIGSKVTQIRTNHTNGSTGTLSLLTLSLQTYGTFARILTTFWEIENPWILVSFVSSFSLNSIITSQIVYYKYFSKSPTSSPTASGEGAEAKDRKKKAVKVD